MVEQGRELRQGLRTEVPQVSKFKPDQQPLNQDAKRDLAWRQNGRDMVAAEVEQMLTRRGSQGLPDAVPKTVKSAAAWILDFLIDPPADDETIRRTPAFNGFIWQTPYRDRAVYLAGKFLRLDEAGMANVCSYARSGIKWRGDDVEFLALLAAERLRAGTRERGREALNAIAEKNIGQGIV